MTELVSELLRYPNMGKEVRNVIMTIQLILIFTPQVNCISILIQSIGGGGVGFNT